jgi:hypothetical protein
MWTGLNWLRIGEMAVNKEFHRRRATGLAVQIPGSYEEINATYCNTELH